MSVKIVYKNYALIDKSQTQVSAPNNDLSEFAYLDGLKNDSKPQRLASFEEQYMRSDLKYKFCCPCCAETENLGYVSKTMCNGKGVFNDENSPTVRIEMSSSASSDGITLFFSPIEEEYATEVILRWQDGTNGGYTTKTFYPDKNVFFCPCVVKNYTAVEVVFKKWSFGNRWARLYRIDYGREVVYEEDAVFSVSVNESANLIADQIEVNTSSIVLLTEPDVLFQKHQYFEIWHNDRFIARHFVKEIKVQGSRVSITGHDMLSKLDDLSMKALDKSYLKNLKGKDAVPTFKDWVEQGIWDNFTSKEMKDIPLDWDVPEGFAECPLDCSFEKGTSKREALTRLCLAVGAYIDTTGRMDIDTGSKGIVIKATEAALRAAGLDMQTVDDEAPAKKIICEENVFSGDSMEYKEPYHSVTIKYKEINGSDQTIESDSNPVYPNSTAKKEFDLKTIDQCADFYKKLANLYSKYYFQSEFYKAKAVIGDNIGVGDRILINDKDVFVIQRTLNLDGDKIIADGTYKLVKGG